MLKYNKYTVYSVLSYVKITSRFIYIGKEGATAGACCLYSVVPLLVKATSLYDIQMRLILCEGNE